jgi:hypothetical protein
MSSRALFNYAIICARNDINKLADVFIDNYMRNLKENNLDKFMLFKKSVDASFAQLIEEVNELDDEYEDARNSCGKRCYCE